MFMDKIDVYITTDVPISAESMNKLVNNENLKDFFNFVKPPTDVVEVKLGNERFYYTLSDLHKQAKIILSIVKLKQLDHEIRDSILFIKSVPMIIDFKNKVVDLSHASKVPNYLILALPIGFKIQNGHKELELQKLRMLANLNKEVSI